MGRCHIHGVGCTQLLGLLHKLATAINEGLLNQLSAMAGNNNLLGVTDGFRCINHVAKQRSACQFMQDFWEVGLHTSPLAGGKNNNIRIVVRQGVWQFAWLRSQKLKNNIDNKLRY